MDPSFNDTPADVLNEARRNLQVLMDSGISREALLALIADSSASPTQQQLMPPQTPSLPHTPIKEEGMPVNMSGQSMSCSQQSQVPEIKLSSSPLQPQSMPAHPMDQTGAMQMPLFNTQPVNQYPSRGHHPRISISSTSSGSSGHASIWSQNSAMSNASSAASTYSAPASTSASWTNTRQNFYWCTSCETRFKRKYDWKRHEEEFHERWKKYPCPEPGCNRSFWGANTFNQHHKSSHGCRTCPHSEKVVKFLRKRKYWACGFCSALHPSRERHVEHVARHFEAGKSKTDWMHSRVIYGLLHQPLIHEAWKEYVTSKHGEVAPNFSWNPTKTGRAQGFMENECPGQLQDLLEFFSDTKTEAEKIVTVAYDLSDIVYAPTAPSMQMSLESPGNAKSMSYPTPPESSLSPISPGAVMMSQHASQHTNMDAMKQQQQFQQMQTMQQQMQQQQLQHRHSSHSLLTGEPHSPTAYSPYHSMMQPAMFSTLSSPQSMPQLQLKSSGSVRRSSLERALPPPPPEAIAATQAMAYDFGLQQNFPDWSSFNGSVMDETMSQASNQGQSPMHQPMQTQQHPLQTDWPMMQFYAPT